MQSVIFGWPGYRIQRDSIRFDPQLPPHTTVVRLTNLPYRGRVFTLQYTASTATLTLESGAPLTVMAGPNKFLLTVGTPVNIPPAPFEIFA